MLKCSQVNFGGHSFNGLEVMNLQSWRVLEKWRVLQKPSPPPPPVLDRLKAGKGGRGLGELVDFSQVPCKRSGDAC